ncbi:MAG: hypothetical protein IT430_05025 [Phycisphaerales bacterium]|nr:hypothetical protein [Phycisphaerales bacterium]
MFSARKITSLLSVLVLALMAFNTASAQANPDDKIWEANATQNGVVLKAKYKESPENGLLDQTLEVQVENAPQNMTLQITINGRVVGTMVTNGFGRGTFRKDIFGVTPGADGRPTGPRINTDDVIRVGRGGQGISATFVQIQ